MSTSSLPPLQLIPEPISRLIRLYEEHADVLQFPDVDAASLSAYIVEMDAQRAAVDEASAALDSAREKLAKAQQLLLDRARQAHAYASVYALTDEKMQEELSKIKMGVVQRTARKRKPTQQESSEVEVLNPPSTTTNKKTKRSKKTAPPEDEGKALSTAAPEPASAVSEPASAVPNTTSAVPEPASAVPNTTSAVPEPASAVPNTTSAVPEPELTTGSKEPAAEKTSQDAAE